MAVAVSDCGTAARLGQSVLSRGKEGEGLWAIVPLASTPSAIRIRHSGLMGMGLAEGWCMGTKRA